jgi:hypothetical protein
LGAKNGRLKAIQKGLGKLGREDKPAGGKQFNAIKKSSRIVIRRSLCSDGIANEEMPKPLSKLM